jgi:YD repeat-containing protein
MVGNPFTKPCPHCAAVCAGSAPRCIRCGFQFAVTGSPIPLSYILGAIGIVLLMVVAAVGVLHRVVSSTDAYKQAIAAATSNSQAQRLLGENIRAQIPALGTTNTVNGDQFTEFSVRLAGSRASGHLYAVANAVNGVWEFSRLWLYANSGEKIDVAPRPQTLKLPSVAAKKVYLVPLDLDPEQSLKWAPDYYKAKLGIEVEVLPAVSITKDWEDQPDDQVTVDELLQRLSASHPEIVNDPANTLIGVTSRDISNHNYGRSYTENFRDNGRFGVISCARFQPRSFLGRRNPELLNSRLQKMLTKNIAILYFNLPLSSDYSSLLSGGALSGTEVDLMSGSIIGSEGQWDPFIDSGDIGVTTYVVPGKPVVWRMEPSSEVLPQTTDQIFSANLTAGLFVYSKTDFRFDGDYPLQFTRVYRTQDDKSRTFGIGANDSLDMFLSGQMGMYIDLIFEDGGQIHFVHARPVVGQKGDTYVSDTDNGSPFPRARAIFGAGGLWTVERRDGWKFYFPYRPYAPGANVTVLTGFSDPAGHKYEMVRDAKSGDLLSVTTPAGAWLHFQRDAQHRISSITDSSGNSAKYEYNAGGLLSHVIDSAGNEERYTYNDKGEMLTIARNSAAPMFVNTYDISGYITSQTLPDGAKFEYHYTRDDNARNNAIVPDVIKAPNGLLTNIQYQADGFRQWLPVPPQPNP